jgi:long-subunit fatty acid transport protein
MRKLGLALLAMAAIGSLAYAQNFDVDFNIMGTGARARGMGGAFIGVADDATAVGWNPAGLAQLDKPEASVVGLFNMKKFSYEMSIPDWDVNEDWEESVSHFAPAFASFIFPTKAAQKNLVFGIAYQRLIDLGFAYNDEGTSGTIDWESKEEAKGGFDAISPAMAIQLTPQVMVGVAGNIFINGYKWEYNETYPDYTSDYYKETIESDISGFNMNAGFLGTFNKINIGAMFRFPFNLKEKAKYKEDYDWTSIGYGTGTYSETNEIEVTMPFMFGLGVALKPTDKLTFAADFERRAYSGTEIQFDDGTDEDAGFKDCNQFRVGMEYIFSGNNAVFPVRLGFRTDPRVYTGMYGDGTDTSQVVGKVFTGGFGLVMGKLMLDLAYEYTAANHIDVSLTDPVINVKADEKSHNIMASAIIHF